MPSEAERCLQIEAAVRSSAGEGPSLQCVSGVEKWRAKDPAWIRRIYIIQDVADRNAEDEAIAPVRIGRHVRGRGPGRPLQQRAAKASSAPRTAASTSAWATGAAAGSSRPLTGHRTLCSWTESEGLGHPQVQNEMGGARAEIDGEHSLSSCGQIGPGVIVCKRASIKYSKCML